MPNGGVPLHMVLYPKDGSQTANHCEAGRVKVYAKADWQARHREATPLLQLTEDEARALAWFLRYWLGEQTLIPGYQMKALVQAEFDF